MKSIKIFQNPMAIVALTLMTLFTLSMVNTNKTENKTTSSEANFNDCTIGEIRMFVGNFAPRNWALCDGQLMPISANSALFSVIGTTYGGDGRTTYAIPDLRGRAPMHAGNGPGLSNRPLGQKSGSETQSLYVANLPSHSHTAQVGGKIRIPASDNTGDADFPTNNVMAQSSGGNKMYQTTATTGIYTADPDISGLNVTVGNTGAGQSFDIMQPYTTVNFIICLQGNYPSRS